MSRSCRGPQLGSRDCDGTSIVGRTPRQHRPYPEHARYGPQCPVLASVLARGWVATNSLRDLNIDLPAADGQRIESSPTTPRSGKVLFMRRDGGPRPQMNREPGLALRQAVDRKLRAYPEQRYARRCKLVVCGVVRGCQYAEIVAAGAGYWVCASDARVEDTVQAAPAGAPRTQEMDIFAEMPALERPKPAEQISTKEPQQEDRQKDTLEETQPQPLRTDLDGRLDERSVLPTSPFRGYRERRRLGQLAKESWQAWQQEHGVTLGQLQRATIPRQSPSLSGQHITRNSIEPDQPANLCFAEWPTADAACSSEASRARDLPTHVGEGGRRSNMQIETDAGRESRTSFPQTSNLQHPAQALQPPLSESTHSAYEALQRCEESLQGTQTQAGSKKHAEPAQTQTTPESTFAHRGHKPMVRHFSYPPAPERPEAKKVQLFNMAAGDMPADMTKSLPCILSPSRKLRRNFQGVAESLQEAAAALQRLSQNCQASPLHSQPVPGCVESGPDSHLNSEPDLRPRCSPRTLQEQNASLQTQLAEAQRRIEELEEERQNFFHEGIYDLVNAVCTSPQCRSSFQDGSVSRSFEEPGATNANVHHASPAAARLVVDVLLQLVSQEHQRLKRDQRSGCADHGIVPEGKTVVKAQPTLGAESLEEDGTTVILEGGFRFTGTWVDDQKQGYGILEQPDGSRFEGNFVDDKPNGEGRLAYISGDVYEGQWVNERAEGFGVFTRRDGSSYEGQWLNDLQHGYGIETWPDGSRFEGMYCAGAKDGHGKFLWSDGAIYKGSFSNNCFHGSGDYRWQDGRRYKGGWDKNKLHGPGLMGDATRVITSEITSMERDAFAGLPGRSTVASGYKA
ncbi:PIP5K5 [Symbiodinium sp. CCMP2592]|nr:PIP5K5 [Symbiodinium sp. CCMP2592]